MASKCFMCGREISTGILCERCDKPRRPKQESDKVEAAPRSSAEPARPAAPPVRYASADGQSV